MHECVLNDEICNYVSSEDFSKLVSEPNISENDVKFLEEPSLKAILEEFGYQELSMWEILFRNPFTCEWEHAVFTKCKETVERLVRLGCRAVSIA